MGEKSKFHRTAILEEEEGEYCVDEVDSSLELEEEDLPALVTDAADDPISSAQPPAQQPPASVSTPSSSSNDEVFAVNYYSTRLRKQQQTRYAYSSGQSYPVCYTYDSIARHRS